MERDEFSGSTGAQNRIDMKASEGVGAQSGSSTDRGRVLLRHIETHVCRGPNAHRNRKVRYYGTDAVDDEGIRNTRVQAGRRPQVDEVHRSLGAVKLSEQLLCPIVHDNNAGHGVDHDNYEKAADDCEDKYDGHKGPLNEQRRCPSIHRSLKRHHNTAPRRVDHGYEEAVDHGYEKIDADYDDHERNAKQKS